MFGIGSTELLVILVVALIVLGPKNLPKMAQTLGKAMGQFQKVSRDFQRTINTEIALEEEAEKKQAKENATQANTTVTAKEATPSSPVREPLSTVPPVESYKPTLEASDTSAATEAAKPVQKA